MTIRLDINAPSTSFFVFLERPSFDSRTIKSDVAMMTENTNGPNSIVLTSKVEKNGLNCM
jgi:hypothetical protein